MIIAVAGQKGGAGKSTIAVSIAAEGMTREMSVLLVDADPQGTARTWGDVAAEGGHPAPVVVAMGATMHKPGQLPKAREGYDLVVIDCPPRHGEIQRSALMVADLVVLPCGQSAADAWALTTSLELVSEAQTVRPDLKAAIVLNKVMPRTALGKGARDVLSESGLPVLRTELQHRVAYQEAIGAGQGVTAFDRSGAALEIQKLFDELLAFGGIREEDERRTAKASARVAAR
jgi:chromosome partitioning protein